MPRVSVPIASGLIVGVTTGEFVPETQEFTTFCPAAQTTPWNIFVFEASNNQTMRTGDHFKFPAQKIF